MHKITPLPIEEMKVFKVIKIVGPPWNWFIAHLCYTRKLTKSYNHQNTDEIDEAILVCIQRIFPNSSLVESRIIFLEGEIDERLKSVEMQSRRVFTVRFFPLIEEPYETISRLAGRSFNAYDIDFSLRLSLSADTEQYGLISDTEICYVPYKQLDSLIESISAV